MVKVLPAAVKGVLLFMRLPICGGHWNNTSNAGLGYLNLNNLRSNVNNNIGSRAALPGCQKPLHYGEEDRTRQKRSDTPPLWGNINRVERPVEETRTPLNPQKGNVHTVNGIWGNVIDFESLYKAFGKASQRKRYTQSSMYFRQNLDENLIQIQNELIWRTYIPRPLRVFTIYEPKERQIAAPDFRDRIVHHSLVAAIEPAFEHRFLSCSYACRKGKGTHGAMVATQKMTRRAKRAWGSYWVLKCDVKKYFPSIRHDLLKAVIRRTIYDRNVLWLIDTIIDSHGEERGIPIGALTSQLFANIYLDQLDHYLKDNLGIKYYSRYMDDFIVLGKTKQELMEVKGQIDEYLELLDLHLNHRTGIWPGRHGIDFCGYRIWPTHIRPRKRTIRTIKRKLSVLRKRYPEGMQQIRKILASFLGYIKHCDAWRTTHSVLSRAVFSPKGE